MKIESTTTTAGAPAATGPGLQGTQTEFLKLFMAQLQHQDPFAPTSGADMVAQLAQLSSVEQARETNAKLDALAGAQASAASAGLANLVGRTCSAQAGGFELDAAGAPPPLEVSSTAPMKGAAVVITDASGREVRRIPIPDGTKTTQIAWDGKGANGEAAAPGTYQISVDAGSSGQAIDAKWHGRVDAVELTQAGPRLRIGGVLLAPADIRTIGTQGV